MTRPTFPEYFMDIARVVATRSDCVRDKVGAVVVQDNRIRSTGYNSAAAGYPGCESCPRRVGGTPPGSDYESGAGLCNAIHAEANALLYCDRGDLPGATLYVTREPCSACSKLIAAVGITDVVYPDSNRETLWDKLSKLPAYADFSSKPYALPVETMEFCGYVAPNGDVRTEPWPSDSLAWFKETPMDRHLKRLKDLAREMAKLTDITNYY